MSDWLYPGQILGTCICGGRVMKNQPRIEAMDRLWHFECWDEFHYDLERKVAWAEKLLDPEILWKRIFKMLIDDRFIDRQGRKWKFIRKAIPESCDDFLGHDGTVHYIVGAHASYGPEPSTPRWIVKEIKEENTL